MSVTYGTMKIIISVLLLSAAALSQEPVHYSAHFAPHQPTLQPAVPRPEPIDRTGYSIAHGDATSSVNVNLQPGSSSSGAEYLTDLATKQYLSINPTSAVQPDQSSYNVGYSINIENNPKLSYRVPVPQNAHSYRQQKLLNAEVITGTHKDTVEKPNYEYTATNAHPNFIAPQPVTKIYSDVRNTHGYTWKSLSPGVEISGYHTLDDMSQQANSFDHAGALGRSQGFDISNVVEKGENQAYDINKALTEVSGSGGDSHTLDTGVDLKFDQTSQTKPELSSYSSQFKPEDLSNYGGQYGGQYGAQYGGQYGGEYSASPFKLSGGFSNVEVDKSLLEGFYKNYNPLFYSPEVTLPAPNLPKNVHLNLHTSASHPSYSYQPLNYKNPQMNMINQHYAFVQASATDGQGQQDQGQDYGQYTQGQSLPPVDGDVKPVTEQQEDNQSQQSQPIAQKLVQSQLAQREQMAQSQQVAQSQQLQSQHAQTQLQTQLQSQQQSQQQSHQQSHQQNHQQGQQQSQLQSQHPQSLLAQTLLAQSQHVQSLAQSQHVQSLAQSQHQGQHPLSQQLQQQIIVQSVPNTKELKLKDHKKYIPQGMPIPVRQYIRPVVYDKNYRMKNLRPPPMIIIHQKY